MSLVPVPSQKKAARPAQPTPDDGSIDGRSQQIIAWQQRREDVDEGRASIQMGGRRAVRVPCVLRAPEGRRSRCRSLSPCVRRSEASERQRPFQRLEAGASAFHADRRAGKEAERNGKLLLRAALAHRVCPLALVSSSSRRRARMISWPVKLPAQHTCTCRV